MHSEEKGQPSRIQAFRASYERGRTGTHDLLSTRNQLTEGSNIEGCAIALMEQGSFPDRDEAVAFVRGVAKSMKHEMWSDTMKALITGLLVVTAFVIWTLLEYEHADSVGLRVGLGGVLVFGLARLGQAVLAFQKWRKFNPS